jgi:peptidoglycan/LPS O-acetylase OafA/YrhL
VVPAIDGMRGLAALLVAVFHCWVSADAPLGGGALRGLVASFGRGVDFFFVISGFVLFLPVVLHGGSFGDVRGYLVRRVARIVPAYYVSLVVQALSVPWLTSFAMPFASVGGWLVFVAHLLFLQHEMPASLAHATGFSGDVVGFNVNGVLWSLSIEAVFYAVLPLVAVRFFRRPVRSLVLAVLGSLAWRALALHTPALLGAPAGGGPAMPRLLDQFPAFCAHFAFGMTGALLFVHATESGRWRAPGAGLRAVVLAIVALLFWTMIEHGLSVGPPLTFARQVRDLLPALLFALLLTIAAIAPVWPLSVFTWPRARWLGDVSYGVFLWHHPLILLVRRVAPFAQGKGDANFLTMCALVLPASLLLGWLSRRFVEEPVILWARRRTRRAHATVPVAAAG